MNNQKQKHSEARQRSKSKRARERAAKLREIKAAKVPSGLRYTAIMVAALGTAAKNRRAAGLPAPKPSAWDIEVSHSPYLDRPRKAMRARGLRFNHEIQSWEQKIVNRRTSELSV